MSLLEKDKRKFSVIISSKKCGACSGASPSGAARKVKGKSGAFYLKETTKGSKKKLYGPYSSKKKVVQRGGKGNEEICKNVLKILKGCDNIHKFDAEMYRINTQYSILEQAYLLLGINSRTDKCDVLKDIIEFRDIYSIMMKNGKLNEFPLCHCLCNLKPEDNNLVELGFINSNFEYITLKIKSLTKNNKDNFYENNWLIFIQFLRNIILQIEVDKLEKNKEDLSKLKEVIQRERENLLKRMNAQKAKNNFHKGMEARNLGSPAAAEENNNYIPPNHMLQAQARRKVYQKPNEQKPSIEERLAAALKSLKEND